MPKAFAECDAIVCFLAVGATVRLIAPLLRGKGRDPGVVCVDEALRYAVPVLGAHGAGNELARRVGDVLGAEPVITTASDAAGSAALDEFGADLGFTIEPGSDLAAWARRSCPASGSPSPPTSPGRCPRCPRTWYPRTGRNREFPPFW